ncbi:hypothetical protein [Hymenobacter sp.]|uniref:hypothetical protein n=1 Tax=Hymenobacter sp. TaxID=1898978 RepID=UPI00286A459D|nr:hypothetical protein [Hymenobacter sp.]
MKKKKSRNCGQHLAAAPSLRVPALLWLQKNQANGSAKFVSTTVYNFNTARNICASSTHFLASKRLLGTHEGSVPTEKPLPPMMTQKLSFGAALAGSH